MVKDKTASLVATKPKHEYHKTMVGLKKIEMHEIGQMVEEQTMVYAI